MDSTVFSWESNLDNKVILCKERVGHMETNNGENNNNVAQSGIT